MTIEPKLRKFTCGCPKCDHDPAPTAWGLPSLDLGRVEVAFFRTVKGEMKVVLIDWPPEGQTPSDIKLVLARMSPSEALELAAKLEHVSAWAAMREHENLTVPPDATKQ